MYKIKKGKEIHYAYSDEEKFRILGDDALLAVEAAQELDEPEEEGSEESDTSLSKTASSAGSKTAKISIQRYKGLGEMNPAELWETTMNPANRVLKRVTVDDAAEADRIFDVLMGTDVASRKSFIQSNARLANLDV